MLMKGGKDLRIDRVRLITELAKREMKQVELAKQTGISRTTVNNIISGKSCSDEVGKKIADALHIPIEKILED